MNGKFSVPVRILQTDWDDESDYDQHFDCRYNEDDQLSYVVCETRKFLLQEAGYTTSGWSITHIYEEFKYFFGNACSSVIVVFKDNTQKYIWPGRRVMVGNPTLFEDIGDGNTVSYLIVRIESLALPR